MSMELRTAMESRWRDCHNEFWGVQYCGTNFPDTVYLFRLYVLALVPPGSRRHPDRLLRRSYIAEISLRDTTRIERRKTMAVKTNMSESDWATVSRKLDEAMQDLVPTELRAKGWRYIDPPTKFSPEMWDYFRNLIGRDEHKLLVSSTGDGWKRGQFLISPQGMLNMADKDRQARLRLSEATP
jgi:hypothetical protein